MNACSSRARASQIFQKVDLISHAVKRIREFQCARWVPQADYTNKQNTSQRKLIAITLKIQSLPCETNEGFNRRACKAVRAHIKQTWSFSRLLRCRTWPEHLSRHPEPWAVRVIPFGDASWFSNRRFAKRFLSLFFGRKTLTRANPSHVQKHWHDRLADARATVGI